MKSSMSQIKVIHLLLYRASRYVCAPTIPVDDIEQGIHGNENMSADHDTDLDQNFAASNQGMCYVCTL